MTAPDPRLEEIEGRLSKATPGPWKAVRNEREVNMWVLSEDHMLEVNLGYLGNHPERNAEFIAHSPADVAYLLAELRKAQDKLARVGTIEQRLERSMQGEDREIAEDLRAAVADATGGERG